MTTKLQSHQVVNEAILKALGQDARAELKDILAALNKDVDFPLRPHATFPTANAVLNFGLSTVPAGDGANKVLAPVKKQVFNLSSNPTINFQSQTATSDFDVTWPVNVAGQFRRAGFTLIGSGKIKVLFSAEAATQGALANPGSLFVNGGLPLGYLDLVATSTSAFKSATAATNIIQNADIYRFGSGAGGGSGTGDSNTFTGRIEDRLEDSYFQFGTPVVFEIHEDTFTDAATADYDLVEGTYRFDNAGETFLSKQLLNAEFLAKDYSPRQIEVHLEFFDDASTDEDAIVSASIDNVTFLPVTMVRQGLANYMIGRVVLPSSVTKDLRLKVESSAGGKKLKAFAVLYDEALGAVTEGALMLEKKVFSGNDNLNSFTLTNFFPNPNFLKVYDLKSGQVYRFGQFSLSGYTVNFPAGFFNLPGDACELLFDQCDGAGYDYADFNASIIAENGLGSLDATINKANPMNNLIQCREDGVKVRLKIYADNSFAWVEV